MRLLKKEQDHANMEHSPRYIVKEKKQHLNFLFFNLFCNKWEDAQNISDNGSLKVGMLGDWRLGEESKLFYTGKFLCITNSKTNLQTKF